MATNMAGRREVDQNTGARLRNGPPPPYGHARPRRRRNPLAARVFLLSATRPMSFLFHAHSGLRYLVLLSALAAAGYFVYALATGRTAERPARVVTAVFVGFLDLQILLGLLLMVTGIYYPALMRHLMMMLLAAAVAHGASVAARRAPEVRRGLQIRLAGVVIALVLIVGGILSIGRSVFGSGSPSVLS